MWYVAHGYFAYANETSFAYPEHLVHEVAAVRALTDRHTDIHKDGTDFIPSTADVGRKIRYSLGSKPPPESKPPVYNVFLMDKPSDETPLGLLSRLYSNVLWAFAKYCFPKKKKMT